MISIIKKEIEINKDLLSKIKWVCTFNKVTPQVFNGNLRIVEMETFSAEYKAIEDKM